MKTLFIFRLCDHALIMEAAESQRSVGGQGSLSLDRSEVAQPTETKCRHYFK